jgi:perosamine synthetase
MTNLQAALGLAQLERLDKMVLLKRCMGKLYAKLLNELSCVQLPLANTDYAENIFWVFGLVLDEAKGLDAAETMKKLSEKGVGCRPFFFPMHQQPVFKKMGMFESECYPVAERLYRQGFYIPSGLGLKDEEIEDVARIVTELLA